MPFTRLTDEQDSVLSTLVDLRKAGTIPSDSFALVKPHTEKLWVWGIQPRLEVDGSLAAVDAITRLGYLDCSQRKASQWQGSLTRKGFEYVKWRRRNPALRLVHDRAPLLLKVGTLAGAVSKLTDAVTALKGLHW